MSLDYSTFKAIVFGSHERYHKFGRDDARELWTSIKTNIKEIAAELSDRQPECVDLSEMQKLQEHLRKARNQRDEAKKEVQREKDRRVEYRQQNHSLNAALQQANKEISALRLQKSLQVTAEDTQNIRAYQESEKAREALQARVTQLELVNTSAGAKLAAIVRRAPAELKQAWLLPHEVIGWYNEFGQVVKALDEEVSQQGETEIANRAAGSQKTPRQDTAQQKLDDIQEIVLRYDGCPAEDYADAWWEVRQQVKGWTQPGT